jgi:peptidoglycan/xylan/chitin deacetylase (PgdA/CDA1 family)
MKIKSNIRHFLILVYWLIGRHNINNAAGKTRALVFHHLDKPKRFNKIITSLKKTYNIVSFEDYISTNICRERVNLILAFDDGYQSWFNDGLTIFKEFHIKPLLFVNSDFIGLRSEEAFAYCREKINTWPEESLTWQQLKSLKEFGCTVGGHSLEHSDLTMAQGSVRVVRAMLDHDRQQIVENLQHDIQIFAYPYGRWNNETINLLKSTEYKYAFTSDSGYLDDSDCQFTLKRTNVGMRFPLVAKAYAAGCAEKLTSDIAALRNILNGF